MSKVMQAKPAEPCIGADRPPAFCKAVGAPAFGVLRKQERVRVAATGQRRTRADLRIRECDGTLVDMAPAQIEHFAAPTSGERRQPDRGDGLGPAGFAIVEPRQLALSHSLYSGLLQGGTNRAHSGSTERPANLELLYNLSGPPPLSFD